MKVIMLMFDSLNKDFLPSYGNEWVKAPNFKRLAKNTVQFENSYAGSLPCMPARREMHTGRYNFLHRSWSPLEPFDDSMPEILKLNGFYSHLISDHLHYWEDGGGTYHTRYNSWEIIRGQEGDLWKGSVKDPEIPKDAIAPKRLFTPSKEDGDFIWRQEWINRREFKKEEDYPQSKTFNAGLNFIKENCNEDNWFLQIESFDPHEPYVVPEEYDNLYEGKIKNKNHDWPDYHPVIEDKESIENLKYKYATLLSKCDDSLGKVLDLMDEREMWKDTMLIVCTDHGFLLGEHNWWAKNMMPAYNEIVNTPLFIWDPRSEKKNEKRTSLVQLIDIAPTILEFFNLDIPKDMQGKPLRETIDIDKKIREYALFGWHGNQVNCTDGKYVYMKGPANLKNTPLYEYTLMPTHIRSHFSVEELKDFEIENPFEFTKGCKTMKIEVTGSNQHYRFGNMLFNLEDDPKQNKNIINLEVELRMINAMRELMIKNDAPLDQYKRLGIPKYGEIKIEDLEAQRYELENEHKLNETLENIVWEDGVKDQFIAFLNIVKLDEKEDLMEEYTKNVIGSGIEKIDSKYVEEFVKKRVTEEQKPMIMYILNLLSKRS